jgi:phosphonoacetaldehyde hydrolase
MAKKIEAVIFDWAGTTVDYGCFAPLEVFLDIFSEAGVEITIEEARKPMGILKIEHIRVLLNEPRIKSEWERVTGSPPSSGDVDRLYSRYVPSLLKILKSYAVPNPYVVETVAKLRAEGIKIGSTTGYTREMMEVVVPAAREYGYSPDCVFTPDGLPAGRPYPWMIYANATKLEVFPMSHIVKVGDTISDIREGRNASCWSIGVIEGSNELGLRLAQKEGMAKEDLEKLCSQVEKRYYENGADFVIRNLSELPELIEKINMKL